MTLGATELAVTLFPGFWQLSSITRTQDGEEIPNGTFGAHPSGSIQYSAEGYMSALVTSTDAAHRPAGLSLLASPDRRDESWALLGRHAIAYSGPWTVASCELVGDDGDGNGDGDGDASAAAAAALTGGRELRGLVVHGDLTAATFPPFVGSRQERNFTFADAGDTLVLSGSLGGGTLDTLVWTRAPKRSTS